MIAGTARSGRSQVSSRELATIIDRRVARRIRERRRQVGMTQQQLARIIGVAFQQTHKYERGISSISAGRLFHIATALNTPIAYFFADDPANSKPGTAATHPLGGGTNGN